MQGAQFVITLLTSEMLLSDFDHSHLNHRNRLNRAESRALFRSRYYNKFEVSHKIAGILI